MEDVLSRPCVPDLDAILGVKIPVLDDGFIRVVDYMGSDKSIVQAARVSYGDGTKKGSDDSHLIKYLLRHEHTTPFEMCELKLHVRVPMDIWRQWIRHRTASVNEYSTRYSIAIDSMRELGQDEWRAQSTTNKQGSGDLLPEDVGMKLSVDEQEFHDAAKTLYKNRVDAGVAREIARKDLPLSTYTEAYWKIDLKNLLNFLRLRMDAAAQKEIQDYAKTIGNQVVAKWVPITWAAFNDYQVNSCRLSSKEQFLIRYMNGRPQDVIDSAIDFGFVKRNDDGKIVVLREGSEFKKKLIDLGLFERCPF